MSIFSTRSYSKLFKIFITLEHMVYFDQVVHTYACWHCLTTACNTAFLMDEALLSISPVGRGQLVKMLIALEPHILLIHHVLSLSRLWYCKTVTRLPGASVLPVVVI